MTCENDNLIRHVMSDEEVVASSATTYQIAVITACILNFQRKN